MNKTYDAFGELARLAGHESSKCQPSLDEYAKFFASRGLGYSLKFEPGVAGAKAREAQWLARPEAGWPAIGMPIYVGGTSCAGATPNEAMRVLCREALAAIEQGAGVFL